jgi:predicted negative regulator of RcsB-dependent stress response
LKRELKKQIKENEFLSGVEVVWKWYRENEKAARVALVAVVLAVAVAAGLSYFRSRQEQGASAAFDGAMRLYETPVVGEQQGAPPPGVTPFKEASEKFTKAAAAFDGVERSYPGQLAGRRARYYAALCRIELGDLAGARQALEALAGAGGLEASLARLSLAGLERRAGAVDKAVEAYRALAEDASFALPRDYVLMTLAHTLEEARRAQEAVASYQSLYERYPESAYAAEAQQRAAYLRGGARG